MYLLRKILKRLEDEEKEYIVQRTEEVPAMLCALVSKGVALTQKIKHAHVLMKIDADGPGWGDEQIAGVFGCATRIVFNIRQRSVEQGHEETLGRKTRERPACEPAEARRLFDRLEIRCTPKHGSWMDPESVM